ncbi:MAG: DinB family protein [Gemmatimonadales bacterium]
MSTSTLSIPRPASDEAAPSYHGYIAMVTGENIGEQLAGQLEEVEGFFAPLDERAGHARYAPGKWSVKEVLGHLMDAERIFAYRLLRISRSDTTPLPAFDENAYVPAGRFDERPLGALVAEFRAVRLSSIALVEGLPPGCWSRQGQASGKAISARALAYIIVGHVTHHLGVLRERYRLAQEPGASPAVLFG